MRADHRPDPNTEAADGREAVLVGRSDGITRFVPNYGQFRDSSGGCRKAAGPSIAEIAECRE